VVLRPPARNANALSGREAVFGMPRAMLRAGADSVLTSLWPVSEREAADMLALYYKHWLDGDDKWAALRKAQLETRAKLIQRTGKDDPSKWGAWVLIGR